MRNVFRLVAMIAASLALAGLVAVPQGAAQTPEPVSDTYEVFTSLAGFESGVVRTFSSADAADPDASPAATAVASPVTGDGLSRVTTAVLQFDTDANALTGFNKLQNEIQGELVAIGFVVSDLGDKTGAFSLEDADGVITGSTVVTQVGNQVVVVLVEGVGTDTETLATELAQAIVGAEAGTDEAQYAPDGTSTGGEWDRLPAADDPALADLPVVEDVEL